MKTVGSYAGGLSELPGGGQKESNVRSIARKLSVAVAAVAMTLSTMTGSADAAVQKYPPAYNMKSQYLGAYPHAGLENASVQRRIYLAAGTYEWWHAPNRCIREIKLGAGWYDWIDYLSPSGGYYKHGSVLDPVTSGWETVEHSCKWTLTKSGTMNWGGILIPQF